MDSEVRSKFVVRDINAPSTELQPLKTDRSPPRVLLDRSVVYGHGVRTNVLNTNNMASFCSTLQIRILQSILLLRGNFGFGTEVSDDELAGGLLVKKNDFQVLVKSVEFVTSVASGDE